MLFVYGQASLHYKPRKVKKNFDKNKGTLIPVYLPTAVSPEFMVMGEIWNISK
jgi:hypothetical protein